jgi:hypothetical protein
VDLKPTEQRYTWITTDGGVVRPGSGGIVIVPDGENVPVLTISEVSDKATINLFLSVHPKARLIEQDQDYAGAGTHEILLDRDRL